MMKYEVSEGRIRIITGGAYRNKTIEDFLNEYRQSASNRSRLIREGKILLDDHPVKDPHQKIGTADVTVLWDAEDAGWPQADHPCEVIYQDAFLYIVHKEPGYIIHGDSDDRICLMAQAAKWQNDNGILTPVRPLHRLDKDTQGLVLFSKIPFFQPWFDAQLSEKKIRRNYLAICKGTAQTGQKTVISAPIGRDRHISGAYRISKTGKEAITEAEVLEQKGPFVLIRCSLETGRTHQIRVHLASRHLPIVNDPLYGVKAPQFTHMGLWAYMVEFRNPVTHKKHRIYDHPATDYTYFENGGIKR